MTLNELRAHVDAVVDYCWASEYADALENGSEGHVIVHLNALAEFIGNPLSDREREELARAGINLTPNEPEES